MISLMISPILERHEGGDNHLVGSPDVSQTYHQFGVNDVFFGGPIWCKKYITPVGCGGRAMNTITSNKNILGHI